MLKDITIGQYIPGHSVIHRLDPRVKLFGTLTYLIALFIGNDIFGIVFGAFFLGVVIQLSGISHKTMWKGVRAILVLILFSAFFHLFWSEGDSLIRIGFINITDEGVKRAVFMTVRLILLVMGSSVMTLTTTPNDLADGLEKGLSCFGKIGLPVHELSMMISIALRFIPILAEEMEKIKSAQMARGADFESGNLFERVKSTIPLLIPLLVSAFRRADDLSMAMEARCYHGGEGRTKLKPLHYEAADYIAYICVIAFAVIKITVSIIAG